MTDIGLSCLVDTNILLRLARTDDQDHIAVSRCISALMARGTELFYTSQNIAEFWNVCTRPVSRNGFGESIAEADRRVRLLEGQFILAPDSEATHREWRRIVVENMVSGVQVHDARLVAATRVHGIDRLLTLNVADFRRYKDILVLSPAEVLAANS